MGNLGSRWRGLVFVAACATFGCGGKVIFEQDGSGADADPDAGPDIDAEPDPEEEDVSDPASAKITTAKVWADCFLPKTDDSVSVGLAIEVDNSLGAGPLTLSVTEARVEVAGDIPWVDDFDITPPDFAVAAGEAGVTELTNVANATNPLDGPFCDICGDPAVKMRLFITATANGAPLELSFDDVPLSCLN